MYLLIGKWGSTSQFRGFTRTKEYSAMKLTLVLVAGSVLVWIAIIAIFFQAGIGTFSILEIQEVSNNAFSPTFRIFSFLC